MNTVQTKGIHYVQKRKKKPCTETKEQALQQKQKNKRTKTK